MAGLGFKDFQVGEVLTSSDVDGYLMQQSVMRFADSAARGSALGTAPGTAVALAEGMVSYLDDTDAVEVYDGSAWTTVTPAGIGTNVVSTTKVDTFSASLAAAAATDVTGLSVSITPTSDSNKVLVIAQVDLGSELSTTGGYINILRDSTQIGGGTAAGNRTSSSASFVADTTYAGRNSTTVLFLDSPATTSATTYKVQVRNGSNDTRTIYVNRSASDSDVANIARTASSITVIEVEA